MKKSLLLFLPISLFILVSGTIDLSALFDYANQSIPGYVPNNRDLTPVGNDISDVGATLGRVLFYDKNLSLNSTVSCSSCHQQAFAFSDSAVVSTGFDGGHTGRSSTRLVNTRFGREQRFFWDRRAATLEDQATQPIRNAVEMGFSGTNGQPDIDSLIRRMNDISYYPSLFQNTFSSSTITEERIQFALAQFMRSIVSFDSKYDQALAAAGNDVDGDFTTSGLFSAAEQAGKDLYMSNADSGCNQCHSAPTFDIDDDRNNNGVITVAGDPNATDLTNTRSPSLRDLVHPSGRLNGPMMHDGSFTTIRQMIDHYDDVPFNNQLDNRLRQGGQGENLNLTETEKNNMEAFLLTLTGVNIYTDEKWSDPFNEYGHLFLDDGLCDNSGDITIAEDVDNGQYHSVTKEEITSESTVTGLSTILYEAGEAISLEAGFQIDVGSTFEAQIADCTINE